MGKIEDLTKALEDAKIEAAQQDTDARAAQTVAWNIIANNPDNYEWSVKQDAYHSWGNEKIQGARVNKRIKPDLVRAWKANGFSTFSNDYQEPDRWFGYFYYRTDEGILTGEGGGHLVLKTPKLCSDEEWESILEGKIPAKFIR